MKDWIKVQYLLPGLDENNRSGSVLVFCSEGIFVAELTVFKAGVYRNKDYYSWSECSTGCGCCSVSIEPTHWMVLPQEPKD